MSRLPPAHGTAAKAPSPRGPLASRKPHVPRPPWAPVQLKVDGAPWPALAAAPNRTGLPDGLKAGLEALSGLAMHDVRVHRNSAEPAKLGALAFAQGGEIHLGSGQERHLPHEAWHVVQQKQGRVAETRQLKGASLNDDMALEREAEIMGGRALATAPQRSMLDERFGGYGGAPVAQAYADPASYIDEELPDAAPEPTAEEDIADMDPEAEVTLARGVSPSQRKFAEASAIRGSYVGLGKMLSSETNISNASATAPSTESSSAYVRQDREGIENLVEFTSRAGTARSFSSEARHANVYYIRLKRKYLSKGSSGEMGWIARQDAPYRIVYAETKDLVATRFGESSVGSSSSSSSSSNSVQSGWTRMSRAEIEAAHLSEQDAEFLIAWEADPAAYLERLPHDKRDEARARFRRVKTAYFAASKKDQQMVKDQQMIQQ